MQYELGSTSSSVVFDKQPPPDEDIVDPRQFDPSKPITRKNVIAALMHAFSFSENYPAKLRIYLEWLKARTGFNYEMTLESFINLDDQTNLVSNKERNIIIESIKGVAAHHNKIKAGILVIKANRSPIEVLQPSFSQHVASSGHHDFPIITKKTQSVLSQIPPLNSLTRQELIIHVGPYFPRKNN